MMKAWHNYFMPAKYYISSNQDVELLVDWRLAFIADLEPNLQSDQLHTLREGCLAYFNELIKHDAYIGFFGKVNEKIVCSAGILKYALPPLNSADTRPVAHLLNVYTLPKERRKGYGRGLVEYIKQYCESKAYDRIFLNATEEGRYLYSECGFQVITDAMVFKF
jgi:GNAT superfamily N-acetyltransferase